MGQITLRGMDPELERKIPEKARKDRKSFTRVIIGGCPRMAIFPPANSGTSPMSGIYASLRQAQTITLETLKVWMPVPLYLSGVVIIFAFPSLKVRGLRLDLGKNS